MIGFRLIGPEREAEFFARDGFVLAGQAVQETARLAPRNGKRLAYRIVL